MISATKKKIARKLEGYTTKYQQQLCLDAKIMDTCFSSFFSVLQVPEISSYYFYDRVEMLGEINKK